MPAKRKPYVTDCGVTGLMRFQHWHERARELRKAGWSILDISIELEVTNSQMMSFFNPEHYARRLAKHSATEKAKRIARAGGQS